MYSNVVNFAMLEFINRINKIQLQSDIIKNYSTVIHFPRFESKQADGSEKLQSPLSKSEIIAQIEKARRDLTSDISSLGIDCNGLDYHCQIQPTRFQHEFTYEQISDDEGSDENFGDDDDVEIENTYDSDCEDRHTLSGVTEELLLKDHFIRL